MDLLKPEGRRAIEEQITRDDPFCCVIPFPCGPWKSLTYFNAARYPSFAIRNELTQKEHIPMLKWIAKIARRRVEKGRLVLLENGQTSRAYKLEPLADLEGMPDGLMDTQFDYVVGDQCLLGQHDR